MFPSILIEDNILKLSYNESHPFLRIYNEKRHGTTEKGNTYLGRKVETVHVCRKKVQSRLLYFRDCLVSILNRWLWIGSENIEPAERKER